MLICYESKPKIVICCTTFAGTMSMLMHWPNLTHPIVILYHLFTFVVLVSINREHVGHELKKLSNKPLLLSTSACLNY